jgi:hypothetical protein
MMFHGRAVGLAGPAATRGAGFYRAIRWMTAQISGVTLFSTPSNALP